MDEIANGAGGPESFWVAPPQPAGAPGDASAAAPAYVFGATEVLADPGVGVRPPRRRTAIVASVAAISVGVVAGGAFAAYNVLGGGGSQPEDVLPANTVAFVKVDLDPSAGQKVALFQLLQKFPAASGLNDSDKTFGDWLMRRLSESATSSDVSFDRDIKPWLGQRFAVADVPDSTGKTGQALLVIQESDDKAAAAGLDKLKKSAGASSFDYAFADGYVVVSTSSGNAAHAAVESAKTASLASNDQFAADVEALGSDEIVTGWADAKKVGEQLKSVMAAAGSQLGSLGSGLGGTDYNKLLDEGYQGRYVLGLHATSDSIELKTLIRGGKAQPAVKPVSALGAALPNAWAVLDVSGIDQSIDASWKTLSALPGLSAAVSQAQEQYGLELPGDLKAILGSELTVSGAGDLTDPKVLAAAQTADGAKAQAALDKVLTAAGVDPGEVAQRVDGNTLYVGSAPDVVAAAGKGTIASDPLFARSVADADQAQVVLFVDLGKVWQALKDSGGSVPSLAEAQQVAAVGVSNVTGNGDSTLTVRVIFK